MGEITLNKPVLILFYGFPGAGKSYIAKNLEQLLPVALISEDKIRGELFKTPRYDEREDEVVNYVMNYMAEEFLRSGSSVIYDTSANRLVQRRALRNMAGKHKTEHLLVWLQIDPESAFSRAQSRDHRRTEDHFATQQTKDSFDNQLAQMQNPKDEQYLVISGKHSFITQKGAILNRLYQMGLIDSKTVQDNVPMPELINLVPLPSAGRVDMSRRDISII